MKDGNSWFSLRLYTMERAKHQSQITETSEIVHIIYTDANSNERDAEFFGIGALVSNGTGIPIVPHSWYHVCLGLDTVSGFLRIVVNGVKVFNVEREEFRNTTAWMPGSLEGKIIVFKQYYSGFWFQHRGKFTNMNIFSSMISLEAMRLRTSGEADCTGAGDYLSWEEMEWSVSGDVETGPMHTEDLCKRYV